MSISDKSSDTNEIRSRLNEYISNLSKTELIELLEVFESIQRNTTEKRKHIRKSSTSHADCELHTDAIAGFIKNISDGGLLIEPGVPIDIGRGLSVTFSLSGTDSSIEVEGKIVRVDSQGIAVKFNEPLTSSQSKKPNH